MTFEQMCISDAQGDIKAARQIIRIAKAKTMYDLEKVLDLITPVAAEDFDIRLVLGIRAVRRIVFGSSERSGAADV